MSIWRREVFRRSASNPWGSGRKAWARRERVPSFESLEGRALLAALQFTAGLGEQSTLDSVAQTANYLSNVNMPGSQQFNHSDGTAVSNVTLTTGPSTVGVGGVDLDVLSQGSVAKKGFANTSVNAGLADSTGKIGSSIPVTIVATNASEKVGDPVTIQFNFAFNVKTFASNTATANISYSARYTYMGTTSTLASSSYTLGGSGITPVGPGPVDHETGTLNAHIGDSFTLSFSDNLGGQTMPPFLTFGINNVGYLIDANLDASIQSTAALTKTTVSSAPNPSSYGQDVTFSAQVNNASPGGTATPTGSVQFYVDGAAYGPARPLTGGTASIDDDTLPAGTHQITAAYTPDTTNFAPSSSSTPAPQVVSFADTITTAFSGATSGHDPAAYGEEVTFAAQVVVDPSTQSTADPTGSVQFFVDGAAYGGPVALGANGAAKITDDTLPVGTHQITAGFLPMDGNFGASLSATPAPQVVSFADTITTAFSGATSGHDPAAYGEAVKFAAQVVVDPATQSTADPTGSVQFYVDGAAYGPAQLLGANGAASITDDTLPVGTHQITAGFLPADGNFGASLSATPAPQVVSFADTITTAFSGATSGHDPAAYGEEVTFAAQVVVDPSTQSTADPTGSVQFFVDGAAYGGPVALGANGAAKITDDTLPVGTHQITAGFLPMDGNFGASLSATPAPQVVSFADTITTVLSGPSPSIAGQSVKFAAQVVVDPATQSTADPTGSVQFYVDGAAYGSPVALDANGAATISDSGLPVGTHQITAGFLPADGNFGASLSTNPATQVVNAIIGPVLKVSSSGLVYNRSTGLFGGTITLTNLGPVAIPGPLHIALTGLPAGVTLANAVGQTASGDPYLIAAGPLAPGQSVTVTVLFSDPSRTLIQYGITVF